MKNIYLIASVFIVFCVSCQTQNISNFNSKLWKQDILGLKNNRIIFDNALFYDYFLNQKTNKVIKRLGKPDYIKILNGKTNYFYCLDSYKFGVSLNNFKDYNNCRGSYVALILQDDKVIDIVFLNAGC